MLARLFLALTLALPAGATTLAYDGKYLAADSQYTAGSSKTVGHIKLYLIPERHAVIAGAGTMSDVKKFVAWYREGSPLTEMKGDYQCLVVDLRTRKCVEYNSALVPLEQTSMATGGSGEDIAQTAMLCGKSAPESVSVACKMNIFTGEPVHFVDCTQKEPVVQTWRAKNGRK